MKLAESFFIKKLGPVMDRLNARWQDESEYEDWRDYEKVVVNVFAHESSDIALAKIEKTPFRVHFSVNHVRYVARCGMTQITLTEVK